MIVIITAEKYCWIALDGSSTNPFGSVETKWDPEANE